MSDENILNHKNGNTDLLCSGRYLIQHCQQGAILSRNGQRVKQHPSSAKQDYKKTPAKPLLGCWIARQERCFSVPHNAQSIGKELEFLALPMPQLGVQNVGFRHILWLHSAKSSNGNQNQKTATAIILFNRLCESVVRSQQSLGWGEVRWGEAGK